MPGNVETGEEKSNTNSSQVQFTNLSMGPTMMHANHGWNVGLKYLNMD